MTWRKLTPAVALAAMLVGGCSSSTSPDAAHGPSGAPTPLPSNAIPPQAAARGVEAALSTVPWTQVGPGWLLATWSPVPGGRPGAPPPPGQPTPETATTTLYLVNPVGGRYPVTTFPPPGKGASPTLVDWSGDGGHALFSANAPGPSGAMTVVTVDLHTGAKATFTVENGFNVIPRYTLPDGKAVLLAKGPDGKPGWLKRVDLAGHPELTYPVPPEFQGDYLSTPNGTQLVLGMASGLAWIGNDGTGGNELPIAGEKQCVPTRWWAAGSDVLARCADNGLSRLWLIPTNGNPPEALTAPLHGQGPDYGDIDAWETHVGHFVQAAGACGSEYLAKLDDGTTTRVSVPDVDPHSSVRVIGATEYHLALQGRASCGGGRALLDYDVMDGKSTVLLGPPLNGGGVIDAVLYPSQQ
jgi:hypothetical protein